MKIVLTLLLLFSSLFAGDFVTTFMSGTLIALILTLLFAIYNYLKKLQTSERKMSALFNFSDVATLLISPQNRMVEMNESARSLLGYTAKQLRRQKWYERLLPDEEALKIRHFIFKTLKEDARSSFEAPLVCADGKVLVVHYTLTLAPAPLEGFILTMVDQSHEKALAEEVETLTTELDASESAFNQLNEKFQVTFDIALNGIALLDDKGKITYLNRAFCEMFEYNEDYIRHLGIRVVFEDTEPCLQLLQSVKQGEKIEQMHIQTQTRTGRQLDVKLTMDFLTDLQQYYLVVQDITKDLAYTTELKQTTKSLEQRVIKDYLTSAYNRAYMEEKLEKLIYKKGEPFGFILLDIDYFKEVNDTYGHLVGDDVLVALVNGLDYQLSQDDTLARFGGEEFVVILPHASHQETLEMAEKLRAFIVQMEIDDLPKITCSFGVESFDGSQDNRGLILSADNALYQAKANGRNCVVDAREMKKDAVEGA